MSASVGSILLDLGLNTAPITAQVRGTAARTQTQLKGAFSGVGAQASKVAGGIGQKFSSLFVKLGSLMTAAFAFGRIKAMAQEWQNLYRAQIQSEIKLAVTMRNATKATMEQIQSVKDLASHYQQLGVLGDEVQLEGMQELATYVEDVESVKKLMPVLNDMVAQQYGYDATGGAAVSLATMIGKVMTGSTTALMRFGYDFTDEQASIIKYGTEAERVATVTEVIEASVRGMNEALAQTPTGKIKQLSNNFGDMKEALGNLTINICAPFVSVLNMIVVKLTQAFNALASFFAALLSISSFSFAGLGKSADSAAGSIDGIAKSAGGAGKAMKSVMGFDQLNKLDGGGGGGGGGGVDEDDLPFDGEDVEMLDRIAQKVNQIKALFAEGFSVGFQSADLTAIKQHAESVKKSLVGIFASDEVRAASRKFSETFIVNLGKVTGADGSVGATLAENLLGGIDIFLRNRGDWLRGQIAELFDIRAEITNTAGDLATSFGEIFSAWKGEGGKKITASIISIFTDAKLHATTTMNKLGRDVFGALARPFIDNASSMKATVEKVLKPIGDIFSVIAELYHEMCQAFQIGYDSFVKPALEAFGEKLSALWAAHLQPMWEKIAGFLERIAALFRAAWNKAQPLVKVFTALLAILGRLLAPIMKLFGSRIIAGLGALADAIGMIFDVLSGLLDFIEGVFSGDWDKAWKGIKNSVSAVWNWLQSSLSPIGSMFGSLWNSIRNNASSTWSSVKSSAASAWDSVKSSASSAWSSLKNGGSSAWNSLKNSALAAWNSIKQAAGSLWDSIKAKFQANTIVSYFSGIWSRVKSAFSSIGTQIGGAMASSINSAINSVISQVQSRINSGISLINSALRIVGFGGIRSLSLPRLAKGGYVRANTPQLAMIGDNRRYGEIVAPEDKMLEMIMTALRLFRQQDHSEKPQNSANQLIELVVNIGDETLMRKIIKILREEGRRGNYEFSF